MPADLKMPGVFPEERSSLPASIELGETGVPVFIGYTAKGIHNGRRLPSSNIAHKQVSKPFLIRSLPEFEEIFGRGPFPPPGVLIEETYRNDAAVPEESVLTIVPATLRFTLWYQLQMFFANGGQRCYIIRLGSPASSGVLKADLLAGLKMAERFTGFDLLVIPEAVNLPSAEDAGEVYAAALGQASALRNRFVIMDCLADDPETLRKFLQPASASLSFGAAYHPYLQTALPYFIDPERKEKLKVRISRKRLNSSGGMIEKPVTSLREFGSLEAEMQATISKGIEQLKVFLPPSASVAAVYSVTDSQRGIWKTPANISLVAVTSLSKEISQADADLLNPASSAVYINLIRSFTGKGFLIWGGRTLDGQNADWKYIPVRRMLIAIEERCKIALQAFVFEPNTQLTWIAVKSLLENFLINLWRQGALLGVKPEYAFHVSVGLGSTMTAQDILDGRMIVSVMLAPVRPSEFIILKISLQMQS